MSDFGELVKILAVNAVEAEKPVDVVIGLVTSRDPLKIKLEQRLTIDRNFVDICANAIYDTNDQVALIRYFSGQRYLLLDKIK